MFAACVDLVWQCDGSIHFHFLRCLSLSQTGTVLTHTMCSNVLCCHRYPTMHMADNGSTLLCCTLHQLWWCRAVPLLPLHAVCIACTATSGGYPEPHPAPLAAACLDIPHTVSSCEAPSVPLLRTSELLLSSPLNQTLLTILSFPALGFTSTFFIQSQTVVGLRPTVSWAMYTPACLPKGSPPKWLM